jgi:hypothetical protein
VPAKRGRLGGTVLARCAWARNAPCFLEKHGASRRRLHTLPTAIEQREPELALQIAELLTERRLLHPQRAAARVTVPSSAMAMT